ncbi:MAG: YicC/YloC family endoribonuclease [Phycisphaerae bacterium]|nr:YicC/YloC family endoribonuclease [Phycisphaerae bacterium]
MIHSMTGFGEAQTESGDQAYSVEIRSVNNRYLKANIKLPDDLAFLEPDFERVVRAHMQRGTITVRLHARTLSASGAPELNLAAIRHYIHQLSELLTDQHVSLDLATLALLPGVSQPHELSEDERQAAMGVLTPLLEQAIRRMQEMRAAEGRALADDLRTHAAQIRTHLEQIRGRAPQVIVEYRDRLHARVQQLLVGSGASLAADDVAREVAVYADRSDISEEISRLSGHLEQMEKYVKSPEPAGRKLEFLTQEMMREANTMGSKTGDPQICAAIIEIKSAVDRMKEQVLNVE